VLFNIEHIADYFVVSELTTQADIVRGVFVENLLQEVFGSGLIECRAGASGGLISRPRVYQDEADRPSNLARSGIPLSIRHNSCRHRTGEFRPPGEAIRRMRIITFFSIAGKLSSSRELSGGKEINVSVSAARTESISRSERLSSRSQRSFDARFAQAANGSRSRTAISALTIAR
jgi:hypothetical protein